MLARKFRTALALGTALSLGLVASPAMAQLVSSGDLVTAEDSAGNPGQITVFNPDANTANISVLAPVVVANWNQFNVPQNTILNVSNASASAQASLLNRVIGGGFSDIGGTINAAGVNLWLINQNGILFGSNTSVNAASFFASTLDVTDADFFDFYEGTNLAGNGSSTVRFSTNPAATTGMFGGGANASFTTDGTLFFTGPALDLTAKFDAGTGGVAFVAATDLSVTFSAGSPVGYSVPAGTTVANQRVGGSVDGGRADFVLVSSAGVLGALLQVDADVATTASPTSTGIFLGAIGFGAPEPSVVVNGALSSTGQISTAIGGNLTANESITGSRVSLQPTGALTAQAVTATGGNLDLRGTSVSTGALAATGNVSVNSGGAIGIASALADSDGSGGGSLLIGNSTAPTSVTITGAAQGAAVDINSNGDAILGNVTSTAGLIDIDAGGGLNTGAVSATGGDAALTAAGGVVTASIASTGAIDVDSTAGGNLSLGNLNAGTTIALDTAGAAAAGSAIAGGAFTIGAAVDPSSISLSGNVLAGSIDFGTTGLFQAADIAASAGAVRLDGGSIAAEDVSATGDITFEADNSGSARFASLISTGGVVNVLGLIPRIVAVTGETRGTSVNLVAIDRLELGDVNSTAGSVNLTATAGTVSAGEVSATGGNARLLAPGAITTASISSTATIDVDSTGAGTLDLGDLSAVTTIALDTTGAVRFDNVTVGAGLFDIGATAVPLSIATAGTIDAMTLSARTTGGVDFSGANSIMALGTISAGGAVMINSVVGLAVNGLVTATGQDVTLKTTGDITLGTGGRVTGKVVALSADGNFVNNRGGDAIAASDHWVVYSNAPAGNTFSNLDSGNTAIWNATIDTLAPGAVSGNRYVFAYQPTLTVSSTSLSKVYGTDLTGMLGGYWTVTGFQPGVAGAYLADTAANTLSGAPTVTSAGAAQRADVAGSPYVMDVEQGTLAASRGYAIALSDAGTLTVTPKPVSASVAADDKTYDGTTAATGSISSGGFLAGDDVTITGTSYTFSDKNAGADKMVTISGATLSGADAGNYTLTVPTSTLADIIAKAIGATVIADNKTYDGTTAATGTLTLTGVVAGDDLGTSGTTFTFADKNAGTDKTVTVSGTTLTGADAGNYVLTVPATALADIFARSIGATVSADDKTYDGTTAATGSVTLTGVIAGDNVGTSGTTFTFLDKNAGTDKSVSVSGTTLTGTDAGNYTLIVPASTLADIFAKAISATVSANDKTYDGTRAATGSVSLVGVIAGDNVDTAGTTFLFADKNAGTNKTVDVAGTTLTGTDAGNYTLTVPSSTLADIFAKAIIATVSADDKTYDGTTVGTGSVSLVGVIAGDSVGTSGTSFTFADKNAGTDKTVTIGGTTLTGADASNYIVNVPTSALADILAKAITATATANDKTYDGTTAATGSLTLNGVIAGDSVATSGTAFSFADKNAGTDKIVTASGTTLTGADAGNYTLTGTATALADILAKAITGSVAVNDKVYDGTTAASGTVTLTGVVAGDAVSTTGTTFTFVDPDAGTDKTVQVGGTALSGADSGNYTLTLPATALADILKRAIEIVAVDGAKFQGQLDPALTYSVGGAGLAADDTITGSLQRAPGETVGTYAIGQGSVTAGANYTITFTSGTFTIRPTPVPNTLRTTQLPSEIGRPGNGSGVSIQIEELCPEDDQKCTW